MAFPVTCPSCGKAFQLATEIYERKVAGKIVSIKCKQCQAGIRVDATQPGELKVVGATPPGGSDLSVGPKPPAAPPAPSAEQPKPVAAPVRMRQPTLIGMVSPAMTAGKPAVIVAPKPAVPAPALWAVDAGGSGDDRELNDDEIRREILAKRLTAQTLVWREGMAEWAELEKVPELARHLELAREDAREEMTMPGAAAEERPKPPEAPAPKAQSADFQEEADAEATMVYDRSAPNAALEPFAPPAPAAPAAPSFGKTAPLAPLAPAAPGFGMTAPLAPAAPGFGMTAPLGAPPPPPLPAAGRPAASAPAASPPAAPSAAARPAPPPPALPGAARPPLPPASAPAQPEPARPAPPPPAPPAAPAFPTPVAEAPVLAAVPWGDSLPSAKPAVPAALPAAPYGPDPFALAAATDLDFPQPRSKKPLVIAAIVGVVAVIGIGIAIASSSSVPDANIAAPPPAPLAPDAPKPPEPTATSETAKNDISDPTVPAKQPDTPSGNFSDLFSKGAEKAKGSGSGDSKAFDEAGARAALSGVLGAAAACKEPGGPVGQSTATITFEPSGGVSGVTVGAPFAGSSTGTCIITAFKRAKVAPFKGLPRTVSQSISLR